METTKVLGSIAAGVLLVGAGALGGANMFPKEIVTEHNVTVEVPVEKIVTKEVIKEVPVEVIKTVEVDNGALDQVMSYVHDNVDEDLTVEYIVFETDAKIEAEAFLREEMISLLDDNDFFDDGEALADYRKSEVSIKKINDAVVLDHDFENKDVSLEYEVKVRAKEGSEDAQYFSFKVIVPFEDGKMISEDVELELI